MPGLLVSPWDLLDDPLVAQILVPLCMDKDKAALDALMQTSRRLRVLAASSIPSPTLILKCDDGMECFPRHA